jgi:hypothetical protein
MIKRLVYVIRLLIGKNERVFILVKDLLREISGTARHQV